MTSPNTCQTCGTPLDQTADGELCSSCLMREVMGLESAAATPAVGLPRRFGDYELFEEIGRGGMGAIYRARQLSLNREVAIKLLLAGSFSSEATLGRFRVEASAAAGLQHPNIVAIHDYGEADGQPYYAMDLVSGRNLAGLCDGSPLAPRRAAELLRSLAKGVHHAHERGVLHRDLKPSNVIVDSDNSPHITDFGLAKVADSDEVATMTGQTLGTPGYLAPEQARGTPGAIDPATDIYGLGALLFHLLTGRAPFNAATPLETFQLVLENPAPSPLLFNPSLPRDLVTICLKCLETDPSRRYSSAAELAEDADRFLADRPILAKPPGIVYRTRKYVRRHWIGVSAAAAVVVALTVGLIASLISYRRAVSERALANAARARSEQVVEGILNDLQPHLQAASRQEALIASIETTIRYFEQLPPEMRDLEIKKKHARELDRLIEVSYSFRTRVDKEVIQAASRLWRELASLDPNDDEASIVAMRAESRLVGREIDVRDKKSASERFRSIAQRYRELEKRFPDQAEPKADFAEVLMLWATFEVQFGEIDSAYDILQEGRSMIEQAVDLDPLSDIILMENLHFSTYSRCLFCAVGQPEVAGRLVEKARELSKQLLSQDPANLRYLFKTAELISNHVTVATPAEAEAIIHEARPLIQKLMLLDPNAVK